MAEKKELDILLERMAKADAIVASKADKVPMSQCMVYLDILDKIHFYKGMKFILAVAPESMNPEKYREHAKALIKFAKTQCNTATLLEFVSKKEDEILNFIPQTISDYKNIVTKFAISFISLWNSENKNKK